MSFAVAVFFTVCALIAGCYGLGTFVSGLSFVMRAEVTTGTVVGQKPVGKSPSAIRSESGMTYQPIVRFVDRGGHDVDFRSTVGYCPPRHRPGQEVDVRYDPRKPAHAVIIGDTSLASSIGFVVLGLFFAVVATGSFIIS